MTSPPTLSMTPVAPGVERCVGGAGADVALGEGGEGQRDVGETRGGLLVAVERPMGLLHCFDGYFDFLLGGKATFGCCGAPEAGGGFDGGIQGAGGAVAPGVEGGEDLEEFSGDGDRLKTCAGPARDFAIGAPSAREELRRGRRRRGWLARRGRRRCGWLPLR